MPELTTSPKPPVHLDEDYDSGDSDKTPLELYEERLLAFEWTQTARDPKKAPKREVKDTWVSFKNAFFKLPIAQGPKELDTMADELLAKLKVKRARYLGVAPDSGDDSVDSPEPDKDPGEELDELEAQLIAVQRLRSERQTELMLQAMKLHASFTLAELTAKGGPLDTLTVEVDDLTELVTLGEAALTASGPIAEDAGLRLARATSALPGFRGDIGQNGIPYSEALVAKRPVVEALAQEVEKLEGELAAAERALDEKPLDADNLRTFQTTRASLAKTRAKYNDEHINLSRIRRRYDIWLSQIMEHCADWVYDRDFDPLKNPRDKEFEDALHAYESARDSHDKLADELSRNKERLQSSAAKRQDLMSRRIVAQEMRTLLAAGAALTQAFKAKRWLGEVKIWAVGAAGVQERFAADKSGGVTYAKFAQLATAFSLAHEQMRRNGFTPDQSKELFAHQLKGWPEAWLPPEMRAQEQNWVQVQELFEDEKSLAKRTNLERFGDSALESAETYQQTVLTSIGMAIDDDSVGADITRGALTFIALCVDIANAGRALVNREKKKQETVGDPVAALMVVEDRVSLAVKCLEGSSKNATAVLRAMPWDKIAAAAPGVGSVQKLTEALHQSHQAVQRWQQAAADAEVHAKALRTTHRAESALDHVASRASELAKRDTAYAATTFLALAGYVCECAGLAAPVGIVIRASAGLSSGLLATGFALEDMAHAETAKKLLRAARAGDADARAEIFRHHARYAAALLALLAQEGDPIAISVYSNHKVTKDMIEKSSAIVLKRYLLREMQEVDNPTSFTDVLNSILATAQGLKQALGLAKRYIEDKINPLTRIDPGDLNVDRLAIVGASGAEVRKAISLMRGLRQGVTRMDAYLDRDRLLSDKQRAALREAKQRYSEATAALKEQEQVSLNAVDDIAVTMRTLEGVASTFGNPDMLGKARARYVALLQEQRDILRQVESALSQPLESRHMGMQAV